MRNLLKLSGFTSVLLLGVGLAFAQEPAEGEGSAGDKTAAPERTPSAVSEQPQFEIRRGFYVEGDFGVFNSFGGTNTNAITTPLPSKGISNVQPYFGIIAGYDVLQAGSVNVGVGLKLAMALNGGAGRVPAGQESASSSQTLPNDYGIMQTGLATNVAIMMAERVALNVRLDGGLAGLSPDPTVPAEASGQPVRNQGAGATVFKPYLGGGLGVELFTLLNNFSVGVEARFQAVLSDSMIPGITGAVPVKYTF